MNVFVVEDRAGEFDVQGFVSQAGHALGECLDAAGIDLRLDERSAAPTLDRTNFAVRRARHLAAAHPTV